MKLKNILASVCLLALSSTASAGVIDYTTFNWSGECSDCLSDKGDRSYEDSTPATGNIILDGFTEGQDFVFDQSNFVSFQYDGPSTHVDQLVIHNANYSEDDQWIDQSNILFAQTGYTGYTGYNVIPTLNPDAVLAGYTHFAEDMVVNGWIKGDLSSYFLNLTFDTFVPVVGNEYKPLSSFEPGDTAIFSLKTFNISYASNGDWSITVDGTPNDIGRGASIALAATQVPEPSSVAILGLGLLGLMRFRKKA